MALTCAWDGLEMGSRVLRAGQARARTLRVMPKKRAGSRAWSVMLK